MENCKMKCWGFKEATEFEGLIPKAMDILGEDYCIGGSEVIVSSFDKIVNGDDQMKVVSPTDIAMSE